jgi:hypothetical protein
MAEALVHLNRRRRFGETMRRDAWWVQPLVVFLVFSSFIAYATWAMLQAGNYEFGPYLSPMYSPVLYGDSAHAWFGTRPPWWPSWLLFSPAFLILPFPLLFRLTCYYYRGAYYKAFWADPPNCAVGEPRSSYLGEQKFPLILQNIHRYALYIALIFIGILSYDVYLATRFPAAGGGTTFGVGVGTLVLAVNVVLIALYTLGCHSLRHIVGGHLDRLSGAPVRRVSYECVSCLNRNHMRYAWFSLFGVAFADLYVRMCAMGIWTDWRLL